MVSVSRQQRPAEALMFGTRLRDFRIAKRWSQDRLAEEAGLTLNYVGNLERGEQTASLTVLLKLCIALEVSAPQLLETFSLPVIRRMLRSTSLGRRTAQ